MMLEFQGQPAAVPVLPVYITWAVVTRFDLTLPFPSEQKGMYLPPLGAGAADGVATVEVDAGAVEVELADDEVVLRAFSLTFLTKCFRGCGARSSTAERWWWAWAWTWPEGCAMTPMTLPVRRRR